MSMYTKLTILGLSLVLFSVVVISFFADRQVKIAFREEIVNSISHETDKISTDIGRFIFSRLNDVRMAAKNPYFNTKDINKEELIKRLQELESINKFYHSFSFFDMNRVKKADSKKSSIGGEPHNNASYWNELSIGKDYAMGVFKSESLGQLAMHFASKVYSDGKQPVGILVGHVLVNKFSEVMGDFLLRSNNTRKLDIHLVDGNGIILYSSVSPQDILADRYEKHDLINDIDSSGVALIEAEETLYFVSSKIGYLDYERNDWKLVLSISNKEAFAPLVKIRERMLSTVLSVVGVTIIFTLIAANFFVRPIVRLSNAAKEIGKGNLSVKIPKGSKGEVGTLTKQFSETSQILIKQIEQERLMNSKLQDQTKRIENQNKQLASITNQITDSINYAERIERSILPPISTLQNVFPKSFVMYKPKDIIGGDFYWFERIRRGNNEYMVIACADCTGHGVPGTIMSIMGSNQLTNIIYYQNYLDPQKIIARLNKVIRFELQNDKEEGISQDGMEIGICVIDLDTLKMEFSGVHSPLRLLKKNNTEMTIYKGPRLMAGGIEGDEQEVITKLKKESIQLEPGDKIYLSSDGYRDQFGGENDKKFMNKNFNKLLENSAKTSMLEQKRIIEQTLAEWMNNTPQTDDILVLGFEITL